MKIFFNKYVSVQMFNVYTKHVSTFSDDSVSHRLPYKLSYLLCPRFIFLHIFASVEWNNFILNPFYEKWKNVKVIQHLNKVYIIQKAYIVSQLFVFRWLPKRPTIRDLFYIKFFESPAIDI